MGDLNILSRPVCWSVIERTNKYAGSRYILKPDELSIPGQLARSKSAESAALCPSDMMLCVISYWVLSGAKRRQIQQLRCCVLPAKLLKRRDVYLKLTRHNGRAGSHGTYNPKHNDRSFNLANSEHIDPERAKSNIYWDCFHGFRSALDPQDPDDLGATFSDVERQFYESRYSNFVESQNERNASGTQSATAPFPTCCPAARPAQKKPSTSWEQRTTTLPQRTC